MLQFVDSFFVKARSFASLLFFFLICSVCAGVPLAEDVIGLGKMKAASLSHDHNEQEVIFTEDGPIQEVRAIKKKCTCSCFYSIGTAATQKKRRIDNCVLLTSGA